MSFLEVRHLANHFYFHLEVLKLPQFFEAEILLLFELFQESLWLASVVALDDVAFDHAVRSSGVS